MVCDFQLIVKESFFQFNELFQPVVSPALRVDAPDAALSPPEDLGLSQVRGVHCFYYASYSLTGPVR